MEGFMECNTFKAIVNCELGNLKAFYVSGLILVPNRERSLL
jgi:hypothetical protein